MTGKGVRSSAVQSKQMVLSLDPALPPRGSLALEKLHGLFQFQFPHLPNGKYNPCLKGLDVTQ